MAAVSPERATAPAPTEPPRSFHDWRDFGDPLEKRYPLTLAEQEAERRALGWEAA